MWLTHVQQSRDPSKSTCGTRVSTTCLSPRGVVDMSLGSHVTHSHAAHIFLQPVVTSFIRHVTYSRGAVCCSTCVLHCVAVCCRVLQCVAVCCSVLRHVAVCCSVLQCVAVCCSMSQCVAACCSVLQCVVPLWCIQTFPRCTGHLTRQIVCSFAWQRKIPKGDIWEFSKVSIVHVLYGKSRGELIFENSFLSFCGRQRFKELALCLLWGGCGS